jgi:hypothetical protein
MESGDQVENLDSAAGPRKNNRRAGNPPSEPAYYCCRVVLLCINLISSLWLCVCEAETPFGATSRMVAPLRSVSHGCRAEFVVL